MKSRKTSKIKFMAYATGLNASLRKAGRSFLLAQNARVRPQRTLHLRSSAPLDALGFMQRLSALLSSDIAKVQRTELLQADAKLQLDAADYSLRTLTEELGSVMTVPSVAQISFTQPLPQTVIAKNKLRLVNAA